MLDKKEKVLENLESIKKYYLKLILIKHFQQDASDSARYENLHELTENERLIIEDINGTMKYIVPDLLILKYSPRSAPISLKFPLPSFSNSSGNCTMSSSAVPFAVSISKSPSLS